MTQPREQVPDGSIVTGYAAGAIAAKLGVRKSGANPDQIALPGAATDPGYGVLKETSPAAGGYVGVQRAGRVVATSGGAITYGAKVDCGTDGKFVAHGSGTIWGTANTATTGADEDFELDLALPGMAVS